MFQHAPSELIWCTLALQALGLASAIVARAAERSSSSRNCRLVFISCLGLMGAAAMVGGLFDGGIAVMCSATLGAMCVVVVVDCRTTGDSSRA